MGKPAKVIVGYDKREIHVRSIIRRIQTGDDNALSDLLPLYSDLIWQHVHMRFGEADDDAYASGMFRLWREARRHKLTCGAKFITILKRGLINEMISVWKRRMTPRHRQGMLYEELAFGANHGCGEFSTPVVCDEHLLLETRRDYVSKLVEDGHSRRLSARYMVEGERDESA